MHSTHLYLVPWVREVVIGAFRNFQRSNLKLCLTIYPIEGYRYDYLFEIFNYLIIFIALYHIKLRVDGFYSPFIAI